MDRRGVEYSGKLKVGRGGAIHCTLVRNALQDEAMDEQFRAKLNAKLAAFRTWSGDRSGHSCRLVH